MLQRLPVAMRTSRVEIALFIGLCALWFCPTCPFLTPAMSSRSCGARRLGAARGGGGGEARGAARSWAASAAGRSTRSEGECSPLFLQQSAGGARRSETQGGRRGGETVSAPRILRRRSSNSRLHQQAGPGLPEGDEGIADLASLANPAKEKDYGDNRALQYGVSVGADAAGAGAAHHFFSADTRVVFGVNALEIGLVELYDMGLQRAMIVTGWNQARADPVVWELLPRGFDLKWHSVEAEPSLSDVAKGVSLALEHRADCVVAMGGAAVIDAAKAIAAIVYADKDSAKAARRLLDAASEPRETAPSGAPAEAADPVAAPLLGPVPLVAIPIIAGTGAEVTPMATILDDKDPLEPEKVTVGFHTSAAAMPAPFMAIVEPRLMMRVDLETTWPRAFVALAGCVEGYVSGRGFVPDLLSHQGIERVSRCLARDLGFRGPLYEEREDIAYAGVIRGLVASRTEWSFLHQLATAVAAVSNAPYASCVARLFPRVLEAQIAKLRREEDAYMDAEHRRRTRARRSGGGSGSSEGGGIAADGDKSVSTGGSGGGREKTYSDDYNDRACAALLKYKRVAGFILGQGGQGGREDSGSGTGRRRRGGGASAAGPSPEDIVEWLDARLLDKNVPPLYRMGLRPEHAPSVVGVLLRNGGVGNDGKTGGAYSALGGLGEAVVMEVVVGEASRQDGDEGGVGGGEAEEAPAEVAAAVAAMFGEGQGQDGPTQRGPWQHRQQ